MHHPPHHPDPSSRPTPSAVSRPAAAAGTVQVTGASMLGVAARSVAVRVVASGGGLPAVTFKGLGEGLAQTTRDRVRAAIGNAGHPWPDTRIIITLSPAGLPKRAGMLDLPIALGLLALGGAFPLASLEGLWALGELGLDGTLRPTPGVLPAIIRACEAGARTILVPAADLPEAVHAPHGTTVLGASSLAAAVAWLSGTGSRLSLPNRQPYTAAPAPGADLAEVTASSRARRALEIAAAGGHSLLLVSQDGGGASALARCLPGLLPDLTHAEALEVARIRSAAGIRDPHPHPVITRPFRAPSDEVASEAFTGGGRDLRPGELTLAHHGVLFLDELPLYRRSVMDTLRQPLQHGWVQVRHGRHTLRLPARFLLAASGTPWEGMAHPHARRMELAVDVGPTLAGAAGSRESSAVVRARVTAARRRQLDHGETLNAHLPVKALLAQFPRASQAWHTATDAVDGTPGLTIGHLHSLLRVARTIADLDGSRNVNVVHITEAASYLPGPAARTNGTQEVGRQDRPQP